MLGKRLEVKILGNGEDNEAEVVLTDDGSLRWSAKVVADRHGEQLTYQTPWCERECDALAHVATWLRSHFEVGASSLVGLSGEEQAA